MSLQDNLNRYHLSLPEISIPGGNYTSINIRGSIAYVAIQFPIKNGEYLHLGRLGNEISTTEGVKAMELCALNVISQVHTKIGFDRVLGLNHIDAYYQSESDWDDGPIVVDGASNLFVKLLEEKGMHSRSILGVDRLPRNFCAGLTASFTLIN